MRREDLKRRRPTRRRRSGSAGLGELRRLFRALGGVAGAVGMRAGCRELAAVDDEIFVADRAALEAAFENFAGARRVSGLRRQATCPRYAASCRDAASCARDGPSAPAAGTRRRRRSLRAARFRARGRSRRGRRSCRARCSRDRRRASSCRSASSLNRCSVSGCSGAVDRHHVADLDHAPRRWDGR